MPRQEYFSLERLRMRLPERKILTRRADITHFIAASWTVIYLLSYSFLLVWILYYRFFTAHFALCYPIGLGKISHGGAFSS